MITWGLGWRFLAVGAWAAAAGGLSQGTQLQECGRGVLPAGAGGVGWGGGLLVLTCTAQSLSMSILGRECLKGGGLANLEGKHLGFAATAPRGWPWYLEPVSGSPSEGILDRLSVQSMLHRKG